MKMRQHCIKTSGIKYWSVIRTAILLAMLVFSCAACGKAPAEDDNKVTANSQEEASATDEAPENFHTLKEPDRIRIVLQDTVCYLTQDDPVYEKLFHIVKTAWDRSKDAGGYHEMIQLGWLDQEAEPEDLSRIVLEYDEAVMWQIAGNGNGPWRPVNSYTFFLDWDRPWAVLSEDEKWDEHAFFPVINGGIGDVSSLLQELETEAYRDPRWLNYYDTAAYTAEDFVWQPEEEPEEGVLDAGSFRVTVPEEWGLKAETVSNDGIVFGYEKDGYTYPMLILGHVALPSEGRSTAIDAEHERCVSVSGVTGFRIWAEDHALGIGDVCAWFAKHTWFAEWSK